ncbi:ribonuclease H-like domain-containing protein [Tanacetum coccineum]
MHDPREPHFAALKRIMRYVQGTLELGLQLYASATTSLVGYTDADFGAFASTPQSIFRLLCGFLVVAETAMDCPQSPSELHLPLLTAISGYCKQDWSFRVLHVPSFSISMYADSRSPKVFLSLVLNIFAPV